MCRWIAQCSHEHADREADAAKHADAGKGLPVGILGHLYDAQFDTQPREAQHTKELTNEQAQEHGKPYAGEEAHQAHALQIYSRIGKGEERDDVVVYGHLQYILHVLQGTDEMVAG